MLLGPLGSGVEVGRLWAICVGFQLLGPLGSGVAVGRLWAIGVGSGVARSQHGKVSGACWLRNGLADEQRRADHDFLGCSGTRPITFFQPVRPVLQALGLQLITRNGLMPG